MAKPRNIHYESTDDSAMKMLADGPVNHEFGLTYASYFVLPRVLMEHMPLDWQERFVALIHEYWREWDVAADKDYTVQERGEDGRFVRDPLANYRHPDRGLLESMRRTEATS